VRIPTSCTRLRAVGRNRLTLNSSITIEWQKAATSRRGNSHNPFQRNFARVSGRCDNQMPGQRAFGHAACRFSLMMARSLSRLDFCMCPYWIGRSTLSYWLCACAALLSCALFAADCELQIDELYQTSWTLKDALPGNIQSLAQTADGYLWLGTASGLFGFDGIDSSDFCPGKASRSRATRFIRCWRYPTAGYGWVTEGAAWAC
jgi:hypothetical protein